MCSRRALTPWLALVALGCGTGAASLRGRVVELPSMADGHLAPEQPLSGAIVTAACPDVSMISLIDGILSVVIKG